MSKIGSLSKSHRWSEIKQRAQTCDSKTLMALLQDLYELSPENRRFLHARFMGADADIDEYRKRIHQAIYPDPLGSRAVRVPEAVRMIRQYYRATGDPFRTINLVVYGLEIGVEQAKDLGMYEEYFMRLATLGKMLLQLYSELPTDERTAVREQFRRVADGGQDIGWGFGDELQELLLELED